jgi:Flp pilus assembly pilin Flp
MSRLLPIPRFTRFKGDEKAASIVEYALTLALITLVALAAMSLLGNQISNFFSSLGSTI